MSNMKQLGLALVQYTQDSDESFPVRPEAGPVTGNPANIIYPYVKSVDVFHCPDDQDKKYTDAQTGIVFYPTSYASTYTLMDSNTTNSPAAPVTLSLLTAPANTVEWVEVTDLDVGIFSSNVYTAYEVKEAAGQEGWANTLALPTYAGWYVKLATGCISYTPASLRYNIGDACASGGSNDPANVRHNMGANYVATDGHAKFLPPSRVDAGWKFQDHTGGQDPANLISPVAMTFNISKGN